MVRYGLVYCMVNVNAIVWLWYGCGMVYGVVVVWCMVYDMVYGMYGVWCGSWYDV